MRAAGLVPAAVAPLVLGLLVTSGTPAGAAAPRPGTAPVQGGASWLAGQTVDGMATGPVGGPDPGLSIDIGLALAEVGDHDPQLQQVTDAVEAHVRADNPEYNYVSGEAFGDEDSTYAGAAAKVVVLAEAAGRDVSSFSGEDFLARLETTVTADGPSAGRIHDVSEYGDSNNVVGQSFAARALAAGGSDLAASATGFLLDQQCAEGWFRLGFTADPEAADQTCDAAGGAADTDVTALAMVNLADQAGDPDVDAALAAGADWLESTQGEDGSFGGAGPTADPNSNSTGLAAWALGLTGRDEAAAAAAAWVAGLQASASDDCSSPLVTDTGAVAYNRDALDTARADGVTDSSRDQFVRSSAQALPALSYLDDAPVVGPVRLRTAHRYAHAGDRATVLVDGLAEGEQACVAGTSVTGGGSPRLDVDVPPRGNRTTTVSLLRLGEPASLQVRSLDARRLGVGYKRRVTRGKNQRLVVRGLADGERARAYYRGRKVAVGNADARGRFVARFGVGSHVGAAKARVVGQFADRRAARTFRVVR